MQLRGMRSGIRHELLPFVVLAAVASCGPATERPAGGPVVERETVGDTTITRTVSGSVWDEPRYAVEELRIGTLEGPDETMFGRIPEMTPDGAGGVFLFDSQVPAIRHFDANGDYLGQVGREGQGPGEYQDTLLGLRVRRDGRLQAWDPRNGRITLYEPDGSFSADWKVSRGLFTSDAMLLDNEDHSYVRSTEREPQAGENSQVGLLHYGPDGEQLESLSAPTVDDPPAPANHFLMPNVAWTRTVDGAWLVGSNATYEFDIRALDGTTLRVQRAVAPMAVGEAEHEDYEARRTWMNENQGGFVTPELTETPWVKPLYHSLYAAADGRIWVHRYGPVHPRADAPPPVDGRPPSPGFEETKLFDIFERDGTYLGEVILEPDINLHHFDLTAAWGTRTGDDGATYLVRLGFEPRRTP